MIKIEEIQKRGKIPILVGGTGLYIKSALYDYKFSNEVVNNTYDGYETEELYEMLKKVDVNTDIHPNNRKRIIRALNYYNNTNKPLSDKQKTDKLLYDTIFIGLTTDRDILYDRINNIIKNRNLVMKYLRVFNNEAEYNAFMGGGE